ncbi:hypothetical protein QAD02_011293 [Eretmocerus hayati]|uniref:Uncharacterized protein n=1 Tax=Eretmocerus hayati TaxID=131215 RepID=A0ACC2NZ58_9HYME|nr:hypothetical protein QAD02_011293 [Eretmocerus hayati]
MRGALVLEDDEPSGLGNILRAIDNADLGNHAELQSQLESSNITEFTYSLPNMSIYSEEFQQFLEKDLFEKGCLSYSESVGRLNWWCQGSNRVLWPLATPGDGNCLLHAASLGMWGFHDRGLFLRKTLHSTLSKADKLCDAFNRRWKWMRTSLNADVGLSYTDEEWDREWQDVIDMASMLPANEGSQSYRSLEEIHILALAHVLRRPIIMIADKMLIDTEGEALAPIYMGGIYLPLEIDSSLCHRTPLLLAYHSGHFSPLVIVDSGSDPSKTSVEGHSIPLVDPDTLELYPVHFAVDPGSDYDWNVSEGLVESHQERAEILIKKYMDCEYRPITPRASHGSTDSYVANNETVRQSTGIAKQLRSMSKSSSKEICPMPKRLTNVHLSNSTGVDCEASVCIRIRSKKHEYADEMFTKYLERARTRFLLDRTTTHRPVSVTASDSNVPNSLVHEERSSYSEQPPKEKRSRLDRVLCTGPPKRYHEPEGCTAKKRNTSPNQRDPPCSQWTVSSSNHDSGSRIQNNSSLTDNQSSEQEASIIVTPNELPSALTPKSKTTAPTRTQTAVGVNDPQRTNLSFELRIEGADWERIKPCEAEQSHGTTLKLRKGWTGILRRRIWEEQKLPCSFVFREHHIFKTAGFPHFEIKGSCADDNCCCDLLGTCELPESGCATIQIKITNFNSYCIHTKTAPLNGILRIEAQSDMRGYKPTAYQHELANQLLASSEKEPLNVQHCPLLASAEVYSKVRQEDKDKRLDIKGLVCDVITALLLMKAESSHIRQVSSIPFQVLFWGDLQTLLWNVIAVLHGEVSIDATASFPKVFDIIKNYKCSDIFFYNIVTHYKNRIYTVCQKLSSAHDMKSIYLWILGWLGSGALVPKSCSIDGSGALLSAASFAFCGFYYYDYLSLCMSILERDDAKKPIGFLPACLIKRDTYHLIKSICQWDCFKKDNWPKKVFYVSAIGFGTKIDNLQEMRHFIVALFIIANSQTCEIGSTCAAEKDWLTGKIETHKVSGPDEEAQASRSYEYISENLEEVSPRTLRFVENLYNEGVRQCDNIENGQINEYYLPKICKNLITLLMQFPTWSCIMNKFYPNIERNTSSARSEAYYKIMKIDYELKKESSVPRFIRSFTNKVDGATKLGLLDIQRSRCND